MAIGYTKYAAILLSAVAGLLACAGVFWSGLTAADWGKWVGAVNTVGTLIGTIWLATESSREKSVKAGDSASVTAGGNSAAAPAQILSADSECLKSSS
jgi:hypothetical protein